LPGPERPEVDGTDLDDGGDVRWRGLREGGDVPGATRTHLNDEVPSQRCAAGPPEGHTDRGGVGAPVSEGRRIGCEHLAEEVLRGGHARGPGDADDGQVAGRVDDTTREGGEPVLDVVHDDAYDTVHDPRRHGRQRAGLECLRDEVVTV